MNDEQPITLAEAATLAPGRPHVSSIWRACRRGIRARSGQRIYLEHTRFGGRVFTTREALARFARRLADADAEHFRPAERDEGDSTRDKGTRRRERDVDSAQRRVEAAGI